MSIGMDLEMAHRGGADKRSRRFYAANAAETGLQAHWYAMPSERAILGQLARFRARSGCVSVRG